MNADDRVFEAARGVAREVVRAIGTDPGLAAAVRSFAEALLAAAGGPGEAERRPTPAVEAPPRPTNGAVRPATPVPSIAPGPPRTLSPPSPSVRSEPPRPAVPPEPAAAPQPVAGHALVAQEPADETPVAELAARLRLGQGAGEPAGEPARADADYPPPLTLDDLPAIASRCRLKASAARAVAEAVREGLPADAAPGAAELRAEAGPECPLWMLYLPADRYATASEGAFRRLGDCFDAVAEAADLLFEVWSDEASGPALRSEALQLGASAQSALRSAAGGFQDSPDRDQVLAFIWMRDTGRNERIYIRNHFRQGDLAPPSICPGLRGEIARLHEGLSAKRTAERKREKLFNKLRYLRDKIAEGDEGGADHHWDRYAEIVAELADLGVPANAAKYRDLVPPPSAWPRNAPEPLSALLGEVAAAAERRPAAEGGSGNGPDGGPGSLTEVIAEAEHEFGDALAFALNNRSEVKGNPFGDPPAFGRALRFLATTYRDARSGRRPEPQLGLRCREQTGFDYSANQSETTVGQYRDYYETTWRGRKVPLLYHLSKGQNHDPRHTLRIAFYWDDDLDRVVVGYVGQHQKTRAT